MKFRAFLALASTVCAMQGMPWLTIAASAQAVHPTLPDASYGAAAAQKADVYLPSHPDHAPILIVVHGGGWRYGDKAASSLIEQKVAYWIPKGFIVVSVNYRMLPVAKPDEQAEDLGRALAWVQTRARQWGGDPRRIIMMGHSSGGHMLALLAADRALQSRSGAKPWLASVILDGAGFDLFDVMPRAHGRSYDDAFGADRAEWMAASPVEHLHAGMPPMLLICSTLRAESCERSRRFADKAMAQGNQARIVGVARKHGEIDSDVGTDNAETRAIDEFIGSHLALASNQR